MFRPVPSEEVYRKLLHGLVVILPLGVFYVPVIYGWDRQDLAIITLVILIASLCVEYFRLQNNTFGKWFWASFSSMLREGERKKLTGASYMAGATFICAWMSTLGEGIAACACLALTLFILGDAAAALAGKLFGRVRVGEKTLEGAIACFLLCAFLAFWIFPQLPYFLDQWGEKVTFTQSVLIGLSVALLELFPVKIGRFKINDNLYVPVLVAYIASIIRLYPPFAQ